MRIIYKIESSSPQYDGDKGDKQSITSFTLTLDNYEKLNSVLVGWKWGWGTFASDFVNCRLWIDVLNKLDECLSFIIENFGSTMLVTMANLQSLSAPEPQTAAQLKREQQCAGCIELAKTILSWTGTLLEKGVLKNVYNSIELINLFLGAFDDELASSALRVFAALAVTPPCHRTVFIYHHESALHTLPSSSNSLFDVILAAGENRMSVSEILSVRKNRSSSACSSQPKEVSSSVTEEITAEKFPNNLNGSVHSGIKADGFYGADENKLVDVNFPSRSRLHSKTERAIYAEYLKERKMKQGAVKEAAEVVTDESESLINTDAVIGNWKALTHRDVAADERTLKDILLSDFVRTGTSATPVNGIAIDELSNSTGQKAVNCEGKGKEKGKGRGGALSWTGNCLCLLWRLRFIRSQRHSYMDAPHPLHSHPNSEEDLCGVMMYYRAVLSLKACHVDSSRITDFFSDKGGPILNDLVSILQANVPDVATDKASVQQTNTIENNGICDSSNTAPPQPPPPPPLPLALVTMACQCFTAILQRAEDTPLESHRMGDQVISRLRQMPSFERVQGSLGFERGQIGGLLPELIRSEMKFLTLTDVISVINATSSASTHSEIDAATAVIEYHYDKLLYLEQLLLLAMSCFPLQGALSAMIDNGMLSIFQAAIASPPGLTTTKTSSCKEHSSGNIPNAVIPRKQKNVLSQDLQGLCGALLELRLGVDSFIVQVLDMMVDSKKRAMTIFHSQGGCLTVLNRLQIETKRPPPIPPYAKDDNRCTGALPFSRQSLLFSLMLLMENLLDPTLRHDYPPSETPSKTPSEIALSTDFSNVMVDVLKIAPPGCQTLCSCSLSLLESLISRDPSPPNTLTHFLTNGLVKSAWMACSRNGILHDEDSLMAILELIASLCITKEGLSLVETINPFPVIFQCFHETKLLLSESSTLVSGAALEVGRKCNELIQGNPTLLPACVSSIMKEMKHVIALGELRCKARYLLQESLSSSSPGGKGGECALNARASVDQGDLRVFHFAVAAVNCMDQMTEFSNRESILKHFLHRDPEDEQNDGMMLLLSLARTSLGSDGYFLTSLATAGRRSVISMNRDSCGERSPFINNMPGCPLLLMPLADLIDKAMRYSTKDFMQQLVDELQMCNCHMRPSLILLGGGPFAPFAGFLELFPDSAQELCKFTNPELFNESMSAKFNEIGRNSEIIRAVTHCSQLVLLFTDCLKFRVSKSHSYKTTDHKAEAEADKELDFLYGDMCCKKKKGEKEKGNKGVLFHVLDNLLEGHVFISLVQELIRAQIQGLWDTAEKKGTGEEALSFNLLVISDRVGVTSGPEPFTRRGPRIEASSTLQASRRVYNEVADGSVRYCLAEEGEGGKGSPAKWISATRSVHLMPPLELVDVIAVGHKGSQETERYDGTMREDTVSLRIAAAAALSLYESSVLGLIGLISAKQRSEPTSWSKSTNDAVESGGAMLRPLALHQSCRVLQMAEQILKAEESPHTNFTGYPRAESRLRAVLSFSHAIQLCSQLVIRSDKMSTPDVNEIALIQLFHYRGEKGLNIPSSEIFFHECDNPYASKYDDNWTVLPSHRNLLESLLLKSVCIFHLSVPEVWLDDRAKPRAEAVQEEIRCASLACLISPRGILNFWQIILQYISSPTYPTAKALEAYTECKEPFSVHRFKIMLCEVLLRKEHLPSLWSSDRLPGYPRGIAELVCELMVQSHRAVCACVSFAKLLEKDKVKEKEGEKETEKEAEIVPVSQQCKSDVTASDSQQCKSDVTASDSQQCKSDVLSEIIPSASAHISAVEEAEEEIEEVLFKSSTRPKKTVPTVMSANFKKKITAIRPLIPTGYYSRTADMQKSNSDVISEDKEKEKEKDKDNRHSLSPYLHHFRSTDEGVAKVLHADTCQLFLRLMESVCDRSADPADSHWVKEKDTVKVETWCGVCDPHTEREKDHWLWPLPLIAADKNSTRPLFAQLVTRLIRMATILHIPPSITAAASDTDNAICPSYSEAGALHRQRVKVCQTFHSVVSLITWLMMRLDTQLERARKHDHTFRDSEWRSSVSGLLLSLLDIITGSAFESELESAASQKEGLLLLFTIHADFKPIFFSLMSAIEDQLALESRNLESETQGSESTRLGGDRRLESAWVVTGLFLLDYVTRPFLPCKLNVAHAIRYLRLKQLAVIVYNYKQKNRGGTGDEDTANQRSAQSDLLFLKKTTLWEERADAQYAPTQPGVLPHVATYDLRNELGPRLIKVSLDIITSLKRSSTTPRQVGGEVAGLRAGKGAGIGIGIGKRCYDTSVSACVAAEKASLLAVGEAKFEGEAYRACLQLLVHSLHDFSLAALFVSIGGLEGILALPSVFGGPVAVAAILHSCLDSPLDVSNRMQTAVSLLVGLVMRSPQRGANNRSFLGKIGLLSPLIAREPLLAYQAMKEALKRSPSAPSEPVTEKSSAGEPLVGKSAQALVAETVVSATATTESSSSSSSVSVLPSIASQDGAVEMSDVLTEQRIITADKEAPSPTPQDLETPFAYSSSSAAALHDVTSLLFTRIEELCATCIESRGTAADILTNPTLTSTPSKDGKDVTAESESDAHAGAEFSTAEHQLSDCLHVLADLLHCSPSRIASLDLAYACVSDMTNEARKSKSRSGGGIDEVESISTDTVTVTVTVAEESKMSLVQFLVHTVLLPPAPLSINKISSTGEGQNISEVSSRPFSPSCQAAVVHVLCSLLSVAVSAPTPTLTQEDSASPSLSPTHTDVIPKNVFRAVCEGFELLLSGLSSTSLHGTDGGLISSESVSAEGVGRLLRGLRTLADSTYRIMNQSPDYAFPEPSTHYFMSVSKSSTSSVAASELRHRLMKSVMRACTFATIHSKNPTADSSLKRLLNLLSDVIKINDPDKRAVKLHHMINFNSSYSSSASRYGLSSNNDDEDGEDEDEDDDDDDTLDSAMGGDKEWECGLDESSLVPDAAGSTVDEESDARKSAAAPDSSQLFQLQMEYTKSIPLENNSIPKILADIEHASITAHAGSGAEQGSGAGAGLDIGVRQPVESMGLMSYDPSKVTAKIIAAFMIGKDVVEEKKETNVEVEGVAKTFEGRSSSDAVVGKVKAGEGIHLGDAEKKTTVDDKDGENEEEKEENEEEEEEEDDDDDDDDASQQSGFDIRESTNNGNTNASVTDSMLYSISDYDNDNDASESDHSDDDCPEPLINYEIRLDGDGDGDWSDVESEGDTHSSGEENEEEEGDEEEDEEGDEVEDDEEEVDEEEEGKVDPVFFDSLVRTAAAFVNTHMTYREEQRGERDEDDGGRGRWEDVSHDSSSMYSCSDEFHDRTEESDAMGDFSGGFGRFEWLEFGRPQWLTPGFSALEERAQRERDREREGTRSRSSSWSGGSSVNESEEEDSEGYGRDSDDEDSFDSEENVALGEEDDCDFALRDDVRSLSTDGARSSDSRSEVKREGEESRGPPEWTYDSPAVLDLSRCLDLQAKAESLLHTEQQQRRHVFKTYALETRRWGDLGSMRWRSLIVPYLYLLQDHLAKREAKEGVVKNGKVKGVADKEKEKEKKEVEEEEKEKEKENVQAVLEEMVQQVALLDRVCGSAADNVTEDVNVHADVHVEMGVCAGVDVDVAAAADSCSSINQGLALYRAFTEQERRAAFTRSSEIDRAKGQFKSADGDGDGLEEEEMELAALAKADKALFRQMLPSLHLSLLSLHKCTPSSSYSPSSSSTPINEKYRISCPQLRLEYVRHFAYSLNMHVPRVKRELVYTGRDESEVKLGEEHEVEQFCLAVASLTAAVHCSHPTAFYLALLGAPSVDERELESIARQQLTSRLQEDVTGDLVLRLLNASSNILAACRANRHWVAAALWRRQDAPITTRVSSHSNTVTGGEDEGQYSDLIDVDSSVPSGSNHSTLLESNADQVHVPSLHPMTTHTYLDCLLRLMVHPTLDSSGRTSALYDIHRILDRAEILDPSDPPKALSSCSVGALDRYSPCMSVSEEAVAGVIHVAVHDIGCARDHKYIQLIFCALLSDPSNWRRILSQLDRIACVQISDLKGQVQRTAQIVDLESRIRFDSCALAAPSAADGELRLLRVLELLMTMRGIRMHTHSGSSAADDTEISVEKKKRMDSVYQAIKRIAASDLWSDLETCMDKIRHLEHSALLSNSTSSSSDSASSDAVTEEINSPAAQSARMKELLRKPTHIVSPLSSRMVPLVECYLRAAYCELQCVSPASQSTDTTHSTLHPLSHTTTNAHSIHSTIATSTATATADSDSPDVPSFTPPRLQAQVSWRNPWNIAAPTPGIFAPPVVKAPTVYALNPNTSNTYRALRTTTQPPFSFYPSSSSSSSSLILEDVKEESTVIVTTHTSIASDVAPSTPIRGDRDRDREGRSSLPDGADVAVNMDLEPIPQSNAFATAAAIPTQSASSSSSSCSYSAVSAASSASFNGSCSGNGSGSGSVTTERLSEFCENNSSLLNALGRQNTRLFEGSLVLLLTSLGGRKILDFDVKRAYLKLKLRRLARGSDTRSASEEESDEEDDDATIGMEIERDRILQCTYEALQFITSKKLLRSNFDIMFVGEDGVDGGGLTREWYALLMREVFRPNYALFLPASDGVTYQPNPNSGANPEHLEYFRLVGTVIGKAVCDGQLLDAHFTRPIYKHMLGAAVSYHDLEAIDPEYYKSLCLLLSSPLVDLGFEDSLYFTADSQAFGESVAVDMIEGGSATVVTDSNKEEYVRLIAHHRMTAACKDQLHSFLEGFHSLIPLEAISFFDPLELELLISGLPDIDIEDLRAHTEYTNYKASDPTIIMLWTVVTAFSKEEKALFVQFFSGTSKVPLDGFSSLQGSEGVQRFGVHKAFNPLLLPTAHTCFNQLDLPEYPSVEVMRSKLLMAIRECSEGFGFS